MLAFSGVVSGTTTVLTQTADDGDVSISNIGLNNTWVVSDGSGNSAFPMANDVQINMLSGNSTLKLSLHKAHPGDVHVILNDGSREFRMDGSSNSIGGMFRVDGGTGNQQLVFTGNAPLTVGGDTTISLTSGFDEILPTTHDVSIGGALRIFGTNRIEFAAKTDVGGFLIVNSSMETALTEFIANTEIAVGGGITYIGGDGPDGFYHVPVTDQRMTVAGPVTIEFGDSVLPADQFFQVRYADFGSTFSLTSTATTHRDDVVFGEFAQSNSSIGGNIWVDLGGGDNEVDFVGQMGGVKFDYRGGSQGDDVEFQMFGVPADMNVVLGGGSTDVLRVLDFDVNTPVAIGKLRADFGDPNIQTQIFGMFTDSLFDVTLLNYRGFDVFQSKALDQVNIVEKVDLGPIKIGVYTSEKVGFQRDGILGPTGMAAVSNLRLTTLANSGDVTVDLTKPLPGFLIMNVRSGNRTIRFDTALGSTYQFGDIVRIDGANGDQTVLVNKPMVAERLSVNLRGGNDKLTFSASSAGSRYNDIVLRGVNDVDFLSGCDVDVYHNVVVNSRFFTESSNFTVLENLSVVGKFTYLGGDGDDSIQLQNSEMGEVYVDLGHDLLGTIQGVVLDGVEIGLFPGASGRLTVKGGQASANSVTVTDSSKIWGMTTIDFSTNTTGFNVFLGKGLYWDRLTYLGGTNTDNVLLEKSTVNSAKKKVYIYTGSGSDSIDVRTTFKATLMVLDFGADTDTFLDGYGGLYPFPITVLNLP